MNVIVVSKHYNCYEESYTEILGVCSSEESADELIKNTKDLENHPLIEKERWYNLKKSFYEISNRISKEEKHSPKKGGWLKKYHIENLPKSIKDVYNKLLELSGDLSYPSFYQKFVVNSTKNLHLLFSFFFEEPFVSMTTEQFEEIENYYIDKEDPDEVTYTKEIFEVK